MSQVIILGSARSSGNTRKAVDDMLSQASIDMIDLNELSIHPFHYDFQHHDDDFIPLIEQLLSYDTWIIATPVYWYSTSTIHKIFLDRLTDLLIHRKDLGRGLRGKKIYVLASYGTSLPDGFVDMFTQICTYLGMEYLGTSFIYSGNENSDLLSLNSEQLTNARKVLGINSSLSE
ncbi:MAG: NAD(P)H-dependent oxidoreductase [Alphaproteobacteria bacterium]|jgi:multimeric flavodoxin WrbA|nr:NAD(P)H-dependent oxidoreductase [Alphaproteobacteria bacterium]